MAAAPQFAAPFPPSAVPVVDDSYTAYLPSFLRPVGTLLDSLDAARDRLNLPEPGKYEDLGREVKRELFERPPACMPESRPREVRVSPESCRIR